jgi:hypothetical protein
MFAVRVRTGSRNEVGSSTLFPATMITAMVSPIARPIPRMTAATSPARAAGSTTPVIVCHWVAPSAYEPSR